MEHIRIVEEAQEGLKKIESAILSLLANSQVGLTNSAIATELSLRTSGINGQKNYLTWSILQEMVRREVLTMEPSPQRKREIIYLVKEK
jgi:hypothetical protein